MKTILEFLQNKHITRKSLFDNMTADQIIESTHEKPLYTYNNIKIYNSMGAKSWRITNTEDIETCMWKVDSVLADLDYSFPDIYSIEMERNPHKNEIWINFMRNRTQDLAGLVYDLSEQHWIAYDYRNNDNQIGYEEFLNILRDEI